MRSSHPLASLLWIGLLAGSAWGQYAPSLTTSLTNPAPAGNSGVIFELSDPVGTPITTTLTQTWGAGTLDTAALVPGLPVGIMSIVYVGEDDFVADLIVTSVGPTSATLDLVGSEISVGLLQQVVLAGGVDPTGLTVGSLTLTAGPGGPVLALVGPELYPAGLAPFVTEAWDSYLSLDAGVIVLPGTPGTIVVDTDFVSDQSDSAATSEVLTFGGSSPDYFPSFETAPTTLAVAGTDPLSFTMTDAFMSRVTIQGSTTISDGAFDLGSYSVGSSCGSGEMDFLYDDTYLFDFVVTSVGLDDMSVSAIVTAVDPMQLDLLLGLGEPDPTGSALMNMVIENQPGGGAIVDFDQEGLFPYGTPPMIGSPLIIRFDYTIPFLAPATPGVLAISTVTESSFGDFGVFGETIGVGMAAPGGFDRGDCNDDGAFDISDPVFLLASLFVPGSPMSTCADACDANDDGISDIADGVYKLAALFASGPAPGAPHGSCGMDPTPDGLDCTEYSSCP